ncbi:MAG TPA: hypothetical protein VGN37_22855 [Actinocatenispora sp.]
MTELDPVEPRDLPDHLAILVVDTKGFSKHSDRQQNRLAPLIPEVLEQASHSAGISELWDLRIFPDSTGDGYMFGFPPKLLPHVVHRYLEHLQAELRRRARALRADGISMRLRLSLHLGPTEVLKDPRIDSPVGATMIGTHRLVDADPLRALLAYSDPDVTFLAAALSEAVMDAAVRNGSSTRHESEFVKAPVRIEAKDYTGIAYLRVPAPSGALLEKGLLGVQPAPAQEVPDTEPVPVPADPSGTTQTVGPMDGNATAAAHVGGHVGVLGGGNTFARDIDQSTTSSTVHGNHYQAREMTIGDTNTGEQAGRRYHREQDR